MVDLVDLEKVVKDYAKSAKKWSDRTTADAYRDGIAGVEEAPGVAAVRNQQALVQNFNRSVEDGTWARNTGAVTLQEFKDKASRKGGANLTTGVREAVTEMQQRMAALGPEYDRIKKTIRAMPNVTEADKDARQKAAQQMMRDLRGKFKARGR